MLGQSIEVNETGPTATSFYAPWFGGVGFGLRAPRFGSRGSVLGSQITGSVFRVPGFGYRDSGLGRSEGWLTRGSRFQDGSPTWRGTGAYSPAEGLGFRVWGLGFGAWVWGSKSIVKGRGFRIQGSGLGGRGFRIQGSGLGVRIRVDSQHQQRYISAGEKFGTARGQVRSQT